MHKKLIMACMAITAFAAFVIAPAAQGAVLTENGTALGVGSSFTAKNTGAVKFTGSFAGECEVAHMQGTLTQNSGGAIDGTVPVGSVSITNSGGGGCKSALGSTTVAMTSEICLSVAKGTDTLRLTGCGGNVKFDLTVAGVPCLYESVSISGTFTTNATPASVVISEQVAKEVGGSFFCPDEVKIDMTLDFYTTGGATGLTFS